MIMVIYILTVGIHVDADGHISLSPDEQSAEQRGKQLLREADDYYARQYALRHESIEKYETVLRQVDVHPNIRKRILLRLAELYSGCSENSLVGSCVISHAEMDKAISYYMELISESEGTGLNASALLSIGRIYVQMGEKAKAIDFLLRARRVALDRSTCALYPSETASRTLIAGQALAELVALLEQPWRRTFRERFLKEVGDDKQLHDALCAAWESSRISMADTTPSRAVAVGAVLSGAITVGCVIRMRRSAQIGLVVGTKERGEST